VPSRIRQTTGAVVHTARGGSVVEPFTRSQAVGEADAALLQMDSATLSPMRKRLQALGLITRLRSATDERTMQVQLTTKGRTLRRRALKIPPAVVERLGVDLVELEQLHDVLAAINAAALATGVLDAELDRSRDSAACATSPTASAEPCRNPSATGSEIFGMSEGPASVLFSAKRPERTRALIGCCTEKIQVRAESPDLFLLPTLPPSEPEGRSFAAGSGCPRSHRAQR
jgi:hypothetical protein